MSDKIKKQEAVKLAHAYWHFMRAKRHWSTFPEVAKQLLELQQELKVEAFNNTSIVAMLKARE